MNEIAEFESRLAGKMPPAPHQKPSAMRSPAPQLAKRPPTDATKLNRPAAMASGGGQGGASTSKAPPAPQPRHGPRMSEEEQEDAIYRNEEMDEVRRLDDFGSNDGDSDLEAKTGKRYKRP